MRDHYLLSLAASIVSCTHTRCFCIILNLMLSSLQLFVYLFLGMHFWTTTFYLFTVGHHPPENHRWKSHNKIAAYKPHPTSVLNTKGCYPIKGQDFSLRRPKITKTKPHRDPATTLSRSNKKSNVDFIALSVDKSWMKYLFEYYPRPAISILFFNIVVSHSILIDAHH